MQGIALLAVPNMEDNSNKRCYEVSLTVSIEINSDKRMALRYVQGLLRWQLALSSPLTAAISSVSSWCCRIFRQLFRGKREGENGEQERAWREPGLHLDCTQRSDVGGVTPSVCPKSNQNLR